MNVTLALIALNVPVVIVSLNQSVLITGSMTRKSSPKIIPATKLFIVSFAEFIPLLVHGVANVKRNGEKDR
jgi:hypothetical protein